MTGVCIFCSNCNTACIGGEENLDIHTKSRKQIAQVSWNINKHFTFITTLLHQTKKIGRICLTPFQLTLGGLWGLKESHKKFGNFSSLLD